MPYCRDCKIEWEGEFQGCPVCGSELGTEVETNEEPVTWVMLGAIEDKLSADFAKEVLASYEIPSVVISKSGYFGQVGLTFTTFYKPGASLFEISVPSNCSEEAADVLTMALGNRWERKKA